eukprot:scaffold3978_cov291-Pinguiococcus_pyrenoidosus.AAC.4
MPRQPLCSLVAPKFGPHKLNALLEILEDIFPNPGNEVVPPTHTGGRAVAGVPYRRAWHLLRGMFSRLCHTGSPLTPILRRSADWTPKASSSRFRSRARTT